jgi:hypothetical protein
MVGDIMQQIVIECTRGHKTNFPFDAERATPTSIGN